MNLKYQQNLDARAIAIVVLTTPSWPRIKGVAASVASAIDAAVPGRYVEVEIPLCTQSNNSGQTTVTVGGLAVLA